MDTKGDQALYIAECLENEGVSVCLMDAGIKGQCRATVSIGREEVARMAGTTLAEVQGIKEEGKALKAMTTGANRLARDLFRQGKIQGIIGLGGSMGSTLASGVMRSFPIGFPKVLISTMASRDTRAFVGTKDIMMLYSVCDLSHLNRVTRIVLKNGAMALAGMLRQTDSGIISDLAPPVLLSTLGTTETCAQALRKDLEELDHEVIMFHTNGSGGKAMEEMITQEKTAAVIDLSLHEIADHLFGGDYDAGPTRGTAALQRGIPTILVPGNIDFLVTGPFEQARRQFPNLTYHIHNAAITVVRTAQREIEIIAKRVAELCDNARGPVSIFGSVLLIGVLYIAASFFAGNKAVITGLYLIMIFLFGCCIICAGISFKTLLQKKVDNRFAGRVFAVVGSVGNASIPGAMIVYGFLLEIYDFQDMLMISGLVLIPLSIISFMLYKEAKHVRATEVLSKSVT